MNNKGSDKNVGSIEKDIRNIKQYINLVLDKGYCDCNELNVISTGKYCDGSKNVAYSMQNILAERDQKDKRIQELEKERDHWHGCFIVAMENGIAKEKVKNVLKNNRNEIFSTTYLSREQFRPYEMQIERINKIEQELLGEDK